MFLSFFCPFYQQLQAVIDKEGAKDMTGDFNGNTGYEGTMGTYGLGQMNENGERFADLCALSQLVIGGSIFAHKPHGDPQTTERKTRLITSALAGSSGGHGEMCE